MLEILDRDAREQAEEDEWFANIAALLLGQVELVAGGKAHRLLEIEFYYDGGQHNDPFAHGDAVQKTHRRWYFHRDEGEYRGGSFKGLDITFGKDAVGGVLIRTLQTDDGKVVNGCSLCVDRLLECTGYAKVAELDGEINKRPIGDAQSPLFLRQAPAPPDNIWKTARVGLTLKRAYKHPEMPKYIMRPYRFLSAARAVKKGRIHHVIGLHKAGMDAAAIRALTGSPTRTIEKYITDFEAGKTLDGFRRWYGKTLKTADLCQLHGAWSARYE